MTRKMMAIKTKTNEPRQAIKMYSVKVNFSFSSSSGSDPLVVGEEVTDWLGDVGVLLVVCCDVLEGAMVSAADDCVEIVSLLMEGVDSAFIKTDDEWAVIDDANPIVEFKFEEKADVCALGVAKELDGDTENGDVVTCIVKTLVAFVCACISGACKRVQSVVDNNKKRTAESAMLLKAALL